ncbi:MAG: NAD(P)H-hydrate dehydratase [Planctomycetia bacterium]
MPEQVVTISASFDPCVMTRGLPGRTDGTFATDAVEEAVERIQVRVGAADAVAVGPGLGRSDAVIQLVAHLWRHLPQPAVFDADALWALAQLDGQLAGHAGPRIPPPHAGELLRLVGADPSSAAADDRPMLEERAATLAAAMSVVVVLKGPATLITDGRRRVHNDTGNPGMATAGTGDVLTGVVAALLAQGLDPFAAARLAAWVHGRAGDVAAEALGEVSMTARDLLDRLPVAFREVGG